MVWCPRLRLVGKGHQTIVKFTKHYTCGKNHLVIYNIYTYTSTLIKHASWTDSSNIVCYFLFFGEFPVYIVSNFQNLSMNDQTAHLPLFNWETVFLSWSATPANRCFRNRSVSPVTITFLSGILAACLLIFSLSSVGVTGRTSEIR